MKRILACILLCAVLAACRMPAAPSSRETRAEARAPGADSSVMQVPTPALAPKSLPLHLNERETEEIAQNVHARRASAIPVGSKDRLPQIGVLWETREPDAEEAADVCKAAEEITWILFERSYQDLTGADVKDSIVSVYTDPTGLRDPFCRVRDPNGLYDLSVRATDLSLICADLSVNPTAEGTDRTQKNISIAKRLGYAADMDRREQGLRHETVYRYTTDTDVCLMFAWFGDRLWHVAVFPSAQAMRENAYFLEDVRFDYSVPAYPECFTEAEPPKDGSAPDGSVLLETLGKLYGYLSDAEFDESALTATFYRDESGAREDCMRIKGRDTSMIVSAYSRRVVCMDCSIPMKELTGIPYEQMGGKEYETVSEQIADLLFTGFGVDSALRISGVDVNSVTDFHICTMDIAMNDGTVYELCFRDGVLEHVAYFANDSMFAAGVSGWVADEAYLHPATGKPFLRGFSDWDGDLHVQARPQQ